MTGTLLDELIWVHTMLRNDLTAIRRIAGADPAEAGAELARLQSRSLLFQLKLNCLGYCNLVHSHHHHEDAGLFPPVLRAAPHLADVVDRLIADHRVVSDLRANVAAPPRARE